MLTYLDAQLHPEKFDPLSAAITQSHQLHADAGPSGLSLWRGLYDALLGVYWHNGATAGFTSFAFFHPKDDYAARCALRTRRLACAALPSNSVRTLGQRLAGFARDLPREPGGFREGRSDEQAPLACARIGSRCLRRAHLFFCSS